MDEYKITIATGIIGYEFVEIIEADNITEATEKALEEVERNLEYMKNHLKVVKVVTK